MEQSVWSVIWKNTLYRSENSKFSPLFTASGINTGLCLSAKTDVFWTGRQKQVPGWVSDRQHDIGSISVPKWHHKGHISWTMYFSKHILSSWWKDGHSFIPPRLTYRLVEMIVPFKIKYLIPKSQLPWKHKGTEEGGKWGFCLRIQSLTGGSSQ